MDITRPNPDAPVGVFDSGLGGITVLKSIVRLLPNEDVIYFGDSLHAPYGTKSREEIKLRASRVAEHLLSMGAKAIVIACNTASAAAAAPLREVYPDIPVIAIEPALKPAVTAFPGGHVVVMATPATLHLEKFAHLLETYGKNAEVSLLPIEGLVELIEQGITEGPQIREVLEQHFASIPRPVDAVVLGCTHYPLIKKELAAFLGPSVTFFDGGEGTARQLKVRLEETGLLSRRGLPGSVTFLNSLQNESILRLSRELFSAGE